MAFCGDVQSMLNVLFEQNPKWPFSRAAIEQFGTSGRERHDIRIYRRGSQTPVISGEVKMPGTPEGRSPYDEALIRDAFNKADNIQCPFFFTWNVNTFVLFDRKRWNVPMIQRRVKDWDFGIRLSAAADCVRPDIISELKNRFLPQLFTNLAEIVEGRAGEWGLPPDMLFLRALESHLDWPVYATRDHLMERCAREPSFFTRLQSWMAEEMNWTFNPKDNEDWAKALERAARTLCYVFSNRAIFYEALRAKFTELNRLTIQESGQANPNKIYERFRRQFEKAMEVTGDYEPIFYPQVEDWAGALIFGSEQSRHGWKGMLSNLAQYDFRQIPHDIVGGIFQRLIAPEERQKFGQYFTNEDIVDIINAFCIHRAGDTVLDPACGSGSFLVRAYHRKAWLAHQGRRGRNQDFAKSHQELLTEIFGCDIAVFAAHLATLNLAARHIEDEENYPCIARRNFFEIPEQTDSFCQIPALRGSAPDGIKRELKPVAIPELDAIIGNPPYVRQELIPRFKEMKRGHDESNKSFETRRENTKEYIHDLCQRLWRGLDLSGRSDLHCYFWPAAASLLKEGGYFGFLTSSNWFDVEYGFALQGWILQNFKLIAVIESLDEPWFPDARIKTAVTILQRCADEKERMANTVKFVRLKKPVSEILGERPHGDETARQRAAEKIRDLILNASKPVETGQLRIVPMPQKQLWEEGVAAGRLLTGVEDPDGIGEDNENDEDNSPKKTYGEYAAGKWGRFLRAPKIYFELLSKYSDHFVRLGEIAEVRYGIKSGCDVFFMPHDVSGEILKQAKGGLPWNDIPLMTPCKRAEVENGKVRIVRAGDGTLHPIETEYLRPEVHSLMEVDRPVICARDLDRVVLWVNKELHEIKGTYAEKYIRWGSRQTFASKKSKAVPVPERSTCASRPRWYDLTNETMGAAFWPMTQKYRHIIPTNLDSLVCNHSLFYVRPKKSSPSTTILLSAILNSTLTALIKHFYGRYAGTEGTLGTEVIDCLLLEIPDPRETSSRLMSKFNSAFKEMQKREITHLVEESLLNCHSSENLRELLKQPISLPKELMQLDRRELDDAVLELIGVKTAEERKRLIDELYLATAAYHRYLRTQDIQSTINRSAAGRTKFGPQDIAESIWDGLETEESGPALVEWIAENFKKIEKMEIPDGTPAAYGADDMFNAREVAFRASSGVIRRQYTHGAQAELAAALARLGIRGEIAVPAGEEDCRICLKDLKSRIEKAKAVFNEHVSQRTGTSELQEKAAGLLLNWFIHGRSG